MTPMPDLTPKACEALCQAVEAKLAQATPGPWHNVAPIGYIYTAGDPYGHGQMLVGQVRGWGHLTGTGGGCGFDEEKAIAIQHYNATLIADAPSDLAALLAHARHWQAEAARHQWQPIETAPINESVFVFIPNAEHYGDGIYRAIQVDMGTGRHWMTTGLHHGRDLGARDDYQPVAWMPLPAAPESGR